MHKIFLFCFLLITGPCVNAQSYRFQPFYGIEGWWGDYMKGYTIDRMFNNEGHIELDLDNKTLRFDQKIIPLKKIELDKVKNTYILEPKPEKEYSIKWTLYFFHLDADNKPVYLRVAQRHTGKDFKKDTAYKLYTNDLRALNWDEDYYAVKGIKLAGVTKENAAAKMEEFYNTNSRSQRTFFSMRDSTLTWKETPEGKETVTHHLKVSEVRIHNSDGMYGIDIYGRTTDEVGLPRYYEIFFGTWNRRVHYGKDKFFKYTVVTELVFGKQYQMDVYL